MYINKKQKQTKTTLKGCTAFENSHFLLFKVKVMDLPRFSLGGMESINFRSRLKLITDELKETMY